MERLSTRFWIAVCALWARDMDTAVTALQDIGDDSPPHITAAVCIEAGRLDEARDVLDIIPDDDDEKPQLLGALKLAVALERVIEEHPVITDESAQGTAPWNDALEQATATLQALLRMCWATCVPLAAKNSVRPGRCADAHTASACGTSACRLWRLLIWSMARLQSSLKRRFPPADVAPFWSAAIEDCVPIFPSAAAARRLTITKSCCSKPISATCAVESPMSPTTSTMLQIYRWHRLSLVTAKRTGIAGVKRCLLIMPRVERDTADGWQWRLRVA